MGESVGYFPFHFPYAISYLSAHLSRLLLHSVQFLSQKEEFGMKSYDSTHLGG